MFVQPGASRSEVVGWRGGELRVRVAAPPERGKANAAVETLVAGALGVRPGTVSVVAGSTGRHKRLRIDDERVDAAYVRSRLPDA